VKKAKKSKLDEDLIDLISDLDTSQQRKRRKLPKLTEEDFRDYNIADVNLSMGHPISKGIPWALFSEIEIQEILKIHFENLGFDVVWRHKDDPANEGGVDLECTREKDSIRTLVSVKKKPKKEALAQVVELSGEKADRRIYVYIGGASQSFRDQSSSFETKVEFWNEKKLEDELNESRLTLRLKVDNSLANNAMFRIMRSLLDSIQTKPPKGQLPKPNSEIMETIWGMKDRAVTVNKCASMAQLLFEESSRFGELSYDQVQNLVVWCLDFIYTYGLLSLWDAFEALPSELKAMLYHVHERTKIRSNWLELNTYRAGLMPGRVGYAVKEYESEKTKWKRAEKAIESMKKKGEIPEHELTRLDEAAEEFRLLGIWAHGLEGTIDYLFEQSIRGNVRS